MCCPCRPAHKARLELAAPGRPPLQTIPAALGDDPPQQDFTLDLAGLAAGEYEVRAVLRDAADKTIAQKAARFRWPPAPVGAKVPSPAEKTLPPLPSPPEPLAFAVQTDAGGGFTVQAGGQRFRVASEFSYPHGGFNVLGRSSTASDHSEPAWKPAVRETASPAHLIVASGEHYSLSRRIEVQPGRVVVRDTITNKTAEPLGILVRNRIMPPAGATNEVYVAGCRCQGNLSPRTIKTNPTVFLGGRHMGLGLAALDDVFIVQSMAAVRNGGRRSSRIPSPWIRAPRTRLNGRFIRRLPATTTTSSTRSAATRGATAPSTAGWALSPTAPATAAASPTAVGSSCGTSSTG